MPRLPILAVVLISTGCSGGDDKPEPCSLAHRDGTYLQSFTEHPGGTCGPLQDQIVKLDASAGTAMTGVPINCALDSADEVSSDQCKLTRAYTCMNSTGSGSVVAISTEQDGGATITGTSTTTLFDLNGMVRCRSTYDIRFVRQ